MSSEPRTLVSGGLQWPTVLAAGICLALAGCGSMPDMMPGPLDSGRLLSHNRGSATETKAFEKAVRNDPFPTAGQSGAVTVDVQ